MSSFKSNKHNCRHVDSNYLLLRDTKYTGEVNDLALPLVKKKLINISATYMQSQIYNTKYSELLTITLMLNSIITLKNLIKNSIMQGQLGPYSQRAELSPGPS